MKKKLLSFVLAICCLIPCAFALTGCGEDPDANIEWGRVFYTDNLENNNIKLTGLTDYGKTLKTLNIPATINDKTVAEIEQSLFLNSKCESVTFPATVTKIHKAAPNYFDENTTLFSDNGSTIDIKYSTGFDSRLNLANADTTTSTKTKLKNINVASDNENYKSIDGVLFNKSGTVLLNYPIGRTETEYTVPEGTIAINQSAFYKSNLEKVTLANSLKLICANAFLNCDKLKEVTYSNVNSSNLQIILSNAFRECPALTSFVVPKNVVSIRSQVFYGDSQLATIEFARQTGWYTKPLYDSPLAMDVTNSTENVRSIVNFAESSQYYFNKEILTQANA